jgi:hypothetical protein
VEERRLVIAWTILPLKSLRTTAATAKSDFTATSKLALTVPGRGRLQRDDDTGINPSKVVMLHSNKNLMKRLR